MVSVAPTRPGTMRMTVETLAAGQPRAYADTRYHYRVTFEWVPWLGSTEFEPCTWHENIVTHYLRAIQGWKNEGEGDWASPRLKFLKNPEPGVWEFMVVEAFTD